MRGAVWPGGECLVPQIGEREVAAREDSFAGIRSERGTRAGDDLFGRGPLGWPGRHDDADARVSRQRDRQRNEVGQRPSAERVAGAHMHHHQPVRSSEAGTGQPPRDCRRRRAVDRHLHAVLLAIGRDDAQPPQQVPLVLDRVSGGKLHPRATMRQ